MKNKITNFLLLLFCLSLNVGIATAQENHEYVDLGLPSGTLWATCNIGAANTWDYGDYFAWGETTTKSKYDWSTYKYANGDYDKLTKYCTKSDYGNNGFTDSRTTLERSDDAATANWGSDWCMPTLDQIQPKTVSKATRLLDLMAIRFFFLPPVPATVLTSSTLAPAATTGRVRPAGQPRAARGPCGSIRTT